MPPALTSLQFFDRLKWLDGRNLLDTIEPYRRNIFTKALDSYPPMASRKSTSCWPAEAKKVGKRPISVSPRSIAFSFARAGRVRLDSSLRTILIKPLTICRSSKSWSSAISSS